MRREEANIIMASLVVMISIIFFLIFPADLPAYSPGLEEAKKLEPEDSEEVPVKIVRPKVEYSSQSFIDPFESSVEEKKVIKKEREPEKPVIPKAKITPPILKLQGLTWGGKFSQAIINDKVVKAGDTIQLGSTQENEISIISINKEGVVFSYQGNEFKLASPVMAAASDKESNGGKR